jgi:hypothetical protein
MLQHTGQTYREEQRSIIRAASCRERKEGGGGTLLAKVEQIVMERGRKVGRERNLQLEFLK